MSSKVKGAIYVSCTEKENHSEEIGLIYLKIRVVSAKRKEKKMKTRN